VHNEVENQGVDVANKDDTDDTTDNAGEFNFVIAVNAAADNIVADPMVKFNDKKGNRHDGDTDEKPPPTKLPVHDSILA